MTVSNVATPLKILLAFENSPQFVTMVNMLAQIKWPVDTSVYLLAAVPGRLPLMDTSPQARTQVDEATEISRWKGWAATKLLTSQITKKLRARSLTIEGTEIGESPLVELALERASTISPDLIMTGVKAFDKPGHVWLNPTAHKLARYAPQSVLVVRPSKQICPLSTILAVDGSPEAWQAIHFVRTLSLPDWARVTLLCLDKEQKETPPTPVDSTTSSKKTRKLSPPVVEPAEAFATEAISYMHDCGVSVRWLYRRGHPASEILSVAKEQEADLIVMGTKYQTPIKPLPNPSITQNIVKYAPCSVLVVRDKSQVAADVEAR